MNIHVLDRSFSLIGIVDSYVSVIWRPSYSEVGDFEIYIGAEEKAVDLLQEERYVVRDKDITVDDAGNVMYRNVMVIKSRVISTDVENGDFLTVTGRELKFLLNQRIVWTQTTLTGTAENGIRRLVNGNAISPSIANRRIPGLSLGVSAGLTDSIEKQITGAKLDEAISEICKTYAYGWEVYVYNGNMVFIVYQGTDRSYGQSVRPYVVFSEDFENLYNTEYESRRESYGTTTLVGGEGEGLDRVYTTVGNGYSGLDRYEVFTDARGVSSNKGSEDELTPAEYENLLQQAGRENLAEYEYTEGFSGEVVSDQAFSYGVDFDLGDLVTIVNKYGITRNARVTSAIESEDENGSKLVPQFNL